MLGGTDRRHSRPYWLGSQTIFLILLLCAGCKAEDARQQDVPLPPALLLQPFREDGPRQARRRRRPVDHAGQELRVDAFLRPQSDQRRQREEPQSRVDLLHRQRPRRRSGADRREQHDVHRHAVSEHALRARPDAARRAGEVELQAEGPQQLGERRGLLRLGQPRLRLRERQDLLQHARRQNRRRERADRRGSVGRAGGRHQSRRVDHDGAAGREKQSAGRRQRRRVRRARIAAPRSIRKRASRSGRRTAPVPTKTA